MQWFKVNPPEAAELAQYSYRETFGYSCASTFFSLYSNDSKDDAQRSLRDE